MFKQEAIAWCAERLRAFAPTLNEYPPSSSATPDYHVMADGLVWSDEYVVDVASRLEGFNNFFCALVSLRTTLILEETLPADAARLLKDLRTQCSTWTFCESRRFDPQLKQQFLELRVEALRKLEAAVQPPQD